jgi:hypothetical protein
MTAQLNEIQQDLKVVLADLKHRGVRSPGSISLVQNSINNLEKLKQENT